MIIGKIILTLALFQVYTCVAKDKFVNKYATMKIYESCFGEEVIRQIRNEIRAASAKCASYNAPPTSPPITSPTTPDQPPSMGHNPQIKPQQSVPPMNNENIIYQDSNMYKDEKINPTIIAYRPNVYTPTMFRPFSSPEMFHQPAPQGAPMMFSAPFQPPNPFLPPTPYVYPFISQRQFYVGQRTSRDLDYGSSMSNMHLVMSEMNDNGRNLTCAMQELGYINQNLEPNFSKIKERIGNLPIPDDLRMDIFKGIDTCQQLSRCVQEAFGENPMNKEKVRTVFFLKCYKSRKLEACVLKDIRDNYGNMVDEGDGFDDYDLRRRSKDVKFNNNEKIAHEISSAMYEFLYGSDASLTLDSYF